MNKNTLIALFILLTTYVAHDYTRIAQSSDSKWMLYSALSFIREGNFDLNEYKSELDSPKFYGTVTVDGKILPFFPLLPAMVAIPFVYIADYYPEAVQLISPGLTNLSGDQLGKYHSPSLKNRPRFERWISSLLIAISAALTFLIASQFISTGASIAVAVIFAYCSPAWSCASRGLWQHSPSILFSTLTLYHIFAKRRNNLNISLAGVFAMLSYTTRPTNSIFVVLIGIFVLWRLRSHFLAYISGGAIILLSFIFFNLDVYGSMLPPYFMPNRLAISTNSFYAILGNLISPGRGLFVFSPIFILGFFYRGRCSLPMPLRDLIILLTTWFGLHLIAISQFPHWWGGYSVGPRLMSDLSAGLSLMLIPFFYMNQREHKTYHLPLIGVFIALAIISFSIHYRSANYIRVLRWNNSPVSIDLNPERIWDWTDLPFLRRGHESKK